VTTAAATDPAQPRSTRRESLVAWFQYAGLWALVVAWPAYQNMSSGPEALTGVGARRLDLLVVVLILSVLAPTVLLLVELAIRKLASVRAAGIYRAVVIGFLVAALVWTVLIDADAPGIVRQLLPLLVWGLVAFGYVRSEFVRNFAQILGAATIVVLVAFALRYPISAEVFPHESGSDYAALESDTPAVIVIFDEFPVASLESGPEKVDRKLFPNFAALAGTSDWYTDMVAVADQTTSAVPAILTGETPDKKSGAEPTPPGLPDHPDTVCTLAKEGGYDVFAYEPITDLCSRTYGLGTRVATLVNRGLSGSDFTPVRDAGAFFADRFRKPWPEYTKERPEAVDAFIEGMPDAPDSLSVLHIALPHVLWEFLPDGTRYNFFSFPNGDGLLPEGAGADVYLQQMLLQLAYTDSELGRIIDKMKADGIWDKSLFVVTADHGASFKPGSSRRILTDDNLGWNLPVPLFIKYPDQTKGKVVRGKADSRDITPTILDVLGGDPPPKADGRSLAGRKLDPATGTVTAKGYSEPVTVDRKELDRQLAEARKMRAKFNGELYAPGGHRDLLGKRAAAVRGLSPVKAALVQPGLYKNVQPGSGVVPAYVRSTLTPRPGQKPDRVAVAVNGRIAATVKTTKFGPVWVTGVTVPPSSFRDGRNEIAFYSIDPSPGK